MRGRVLQARFGEKRPAAHLALRAELEVAEVELDVSPAAGARYLGRGVGGSLGRRRGVVGAQRPAGNVRAGQALNGRSRGARVGKLDEAKACVQCSVRGCVSLARWRGWGRVGTVRAGQTSSAPASPGAECAHARTRARLRPQRFGSTLGECTFKSDHGARVAAARRTGSRGADIIVRECARAAREGARLRALSRHAPLCCCFFEPLSFGRSTSATSP